MTAYFNKWMRIDKSPDESWEDDKYYNALCDVNEVVYKTRDIGEFAEYIRRVWIRRFGDKSRSFEDYMKIAGEVISAINE